MPQLRELRLNAVCRHTDAGAAGSVPTLTTLSAMTQASPSSSTCT